MNTISFAIVDLALLLATVGFGIATLRKWAQHRTTGFPLVKISTHVTVQVIAICVWFSFIVTGSVILAWAAFVLLTVGQVFGDLLMFASHRARHPGEKKPGYLAVGGDVLSFRRPLAALHALVGALAWFGMLAVCIVVTVVR